MKTTFKVYSHYASLFVGRMEALIEFQAEIPPEKFIAYTNEYFSQLVEQCPDWFESYLKRKNESQTSNVKETRISIPPAS